MAFCSGGRRSIQLSYEGRDARHYPIREPRSSEISGSLWDPRRYTPPMPIRTQLIAAIESALDDIGVERPAKGVALERPAIADHGDWSSNVAMATAKAAGRNPRELAQELADRLLADPPPHVVGVEIAGPGFLNFRLADSWLHDVLTQVVAEGVDGYATPDLGGGRSVNVEFVSANPTGPLHAAHGRGAAYGDSLARILARTGHRVTKECYLNDRGTQMGLFAESLRRRKAGEELGDDHYKGQYVIDWAAEMPDDADPMEWGRERAIASHRETLAAMNVEFDVWFSERSLLDSGAIEQTLDDLRSKGVVFEDDGATWLRSTDFGDDKDRVLVKSDGELTYLTPDIAYHRDKLARGHDELIDVWGADHHGYIARMRAALTALGLDAAAFSVPIVQMVSLMRGGEEVRLSKRSGDIIELGDIIEEVGPDVTRLTYLLGSLDSKMVFDFDVVTQQANENPVFYVQYANARIHSVARKAAEAGITPKPVAEVDLSLLTHERELALLRCCHALPDAVEIAAKDRSPHRISNWVRELAGAFHGFYHDCRILGDEVDPELTQARLAVIEAARISIDIGAELLGVSLPESM